jgi:hypothetical protein
MLYVVIEEVWSISPDEEKRGPVSRSERPLFAGDRQAALNHAKQRAGKFEKCDYEDDATYPYFWGRNEGDKANHRFIVKPALSG